jgi:oligo-1,6-glucosidase
VNPNHAEINAEADRADPDGVFARYRALADLRRASAIVRHGRTVPFDMEHGQVMAYAREHADGRIAVAVNLSDGPVAWGVPDGLACAGAALFGGRAELAGTVELAPWEVVAIEAG